MFSSFIVNGASSEEYGIICVKFDSTSGAETISGGIETELNMKKSSIGGKFYITNQVYTKPMQFTFQIINHDGSNITSEKEREIKKWLCRRGIFYPFYIDDVRYINVEFNVNINNPKIIIVGNVVGMEFTITCNSPYGYSHIIKKSLKISSQNQNIKLMISNDEDDYIYPSMKITSNVTGDLSITNNIEPTRTFTIKNLIVGEIIIIDGDIRNITTSITSHKVWADFNKKWMRLVDGINSLTFSNLCTVDISYKETRILGV